MYFLCLAGMESSSDTVESAAAYLFDLFKTSQSVGQSEARSLRSTFGPYPASHATKACQIVNKIVSALPDQVNMTFSWPNILAGLLTFDK